MKIPNWADESLSAELPAHRKTGEGQNLEFKEDFPEQAHELGKEVAAFATSKGGTILLGVRDNGALAGLKARNAADRDRLVERARGIIRTVKPRVSVEIAFARESNKTVLCIRIPKQEEPVFYYEYRPYLRDGARSRPAEPEEVKELVWSCPSAEHKRRMEEIELKQVENIVEQGRRFGELHEETNRRFMER